MSKEIPTSFPEVTVRKATRVVYEAQKRGRLTLVQQLTQKNADSMDALRKEAALFANNTEGAPKEVMLDETVRHLFPEEFFANPTAWIESQPRLVSSEQQTGLRGFSGTIGHISSLSHDADIERVKRLMLCDSDGRAVTIVSKRINPKHDDWYEVDAARRAYALGIPTPRVLGTVTDHGNFYALYEYIPSIDFWKIQSSFGVDNPYTSAAELRRAGKRFLSLGQYRIFRELSRQERELEQLNNFERKWLKIILKTIRITFSALEQGAEAPERFLQSLSAQIEAILPSGSAVDTYMSLMPFATRNALARQMAIWTVQQYAFTSSNSAGKSPIFSEIVKGIEPGSEEQLKRCEVAVSCAHTILRAQPKSAVRSVWAEASSVKEQMCELIQGAIFGKDGVISVRKQARSIELLCRQEDLAPYNREEIPSRNIAIAWDAATDRPRRRADGSIDMYILDWERTVNCRRSNV